jgi:formate hydrogenlyase subunit 4
MMIASLAEPATLLVVFTVALFAGTTQLTSIADYMLTHDVGLRVSLGLSLVALVMVALAENARIPIDNPTTHLELTMVHEAMVLEYSGRHLAMIELASALKLTMYLSLIACVFFPFGIAQGGGAGVLELLHGLLVYLAKLAALATALAAFEVTVAKLRVFRVGEFLGGALMLGFLATLLLFVSRSM